MSYAALFVTLPAKAGTGRMRVWRALRALGCATLRDGVYLLPDFADGEAALQQVGVDVRGAEGTAEIFSLASRDDDQEAALRALFDRTGDYAEVIADCRHLRGDLTKKDAGDGGGGLARRLATVSRRYDQITRVDFFPGEPQRQALAALDEVRVAVARWLSPDEPCGLDDTLPPRLAVAQYQGRIWATRKTMWVDRMACAWLIRRHIDAQAQFVWLAHPADCQPDWIGFDFDGAAFTHVGNRVTFETLLASFGLDADSALLRLGEVVHVLDVGGVPVPEARGVELVLAGLRHGAADDDCLLDLVTPVFDGLRDVFGKEQPR
jgi:hypothetical protein